MGHQLLLHTASTPAPTVGWLGLDWGSIAFVFVVGLVVTVLITSAFAVGTRLLAVGAPDAIVHAGMEADDPGVVTPARTEPRPVVATIGAWVCYAIGIVAVAYGLYMVIPAFHQ
jgi:hypothetical protein